MLKTTLLDVLKTFSKDEFKKFDDFVNSPYFNKKTPVTNLWKEIKKHSPEFISENLDRKKIYLELFPGKQFNYGVMKNLIYDLTQLSERFLEEEIFIKNEFRRSELLMENLNQKGLLKLFISKFKTAEKKILNSKKDAEYYEKLASLEWMKETFPDNVDKTDRGNVTLISEFTVYSLLINLFKIYNNIYSAKISTNYVNDYNLLEKFLSKLDLEYLIARMKKYSIKDFKIVNIYYSMYKAFINNDNAESFVEFKNNIQQNSDLISSVEVKNLYACLWTVISNNRHVKNKTGEFLRIIKIEHSKNLLLTDDVLSVREFTLSVRIAAMVKDSEFIKVMMTSYLSRLAPSVRDNMKLYAMAYMHFSKNEFSNALELVNKIKIDLLTFKFELKNLQLMLFYELNDPNSLFYNLDSYRHFASKNQFVSTSLKENIFKFINYINTLQKLKENPDEIRLGFLKKSILDDELNTKSWLLKKIDELEK